MLDVWQYCEQIFVAIANVELNKKWYPLWNFFWFLDSYFSEYIRTAMVILDRKIKLKTGNVVYIRKIANLPENYFCRDDAVISYLLVPAALWLPWFHLFMLLKSIWKTIYFIAAK